MRVFRYSVSLLRKCSCANRFDCLGDLEVASGLKKVGDSFCKYTIYNDFKQAIRKNHSSSSYFFMSVIKKQQKMEKQNCEHGFLLKAVM